MKTAIRIIDEIIEMILDFLFMAWVLFFAVVAAILLGA